MNDTLRIRQLERELDRARSQETPALSGAAFPATPPGHPFFRTDLGWWCYYDGSRWLTCEEFAMNIPQNISPYTYGTQFAIGDLRTDYQFYVTRVSAQSYVYTTNNGSNYWTVTIRSINSDYTAATNLYSFNTSADSASAWAHHEGAPSTATNASNKHGLDVVYGISAGTPGNLHFAATVYYRLIVT